MYMSSYNLRNIACIIDTINNEVAQFEESYIRGGLKICIPYIEIALEDNVIGCAERVDEDIFVFSTEIPK